ncbi:MAG: hypothetical protein ABIH22_03825 [Candidatus Margulisiibacteriota bacterium]
MANGTADAIGFFVVCLFLIAVWSFIFFYYRFYYRRRHQEDVISDQSGAMIVPLVAAFSGLKFMPTWWTLGNNNANPKLILREAGIEYRVFLTRQKTYSEIELVDVSKSLGTNKLCFYFRNSNWIFMANIGDEKKLSPVLKFLKQKGVLLGKAAESYLLK